MDALVILFCGIGFFFIFTAVIGVLRLPDFYCRLHAVGKSDTLGISLILFSLMIYEGFSLPSLKIFIILLCVFFANPTITHALARAAWKSGLKPWKKEIKP